MFLYRDAENFLDSFINYEKKRFFPYKKSLRLKRVRELFKILGISFKRIESIHIAGTKGKGSTAHFCAFLLASCGYKIGLYTSPHFFTFRERIKIIDKDAVFPQRVKSRMISKAEVAKNTEEIKQLLKVDRLKIEPTFFEVYTALAFKYFLQKSVDFAVFETGLGGRLDATNIVKPLVSIITRIGYDHMDKLGKSLLSIAWEKAGIIKRGVPVVSSFQRESAYKVIKDKCIKLNSPLFTLGRDFNISNIRLKRNYTLFDFKFDSFSLDDLKITLKGRHQIENASLALAAVHILRQRNKIKSDFCTKRALSEVFLGGRFEVVRKNPLTVLDIAHNELSFSALKRSLKDYFPSKKIILVFSASNDKDVKKMLKGFSYQHVIFTSFSNPRSLTPLEIKEKCNIKNADLAKNIGSALKLAEKFYNKKDCLILICGSLFLVSEAKEYLSSNMQPQ